MTNHNGTLRLEGSLTKWYRLSVCPSVLTG